MSHGGDVLNKESLITGIYFYFSFVNTSMLGKYFYMDNVMIVEDYKNII